MVLLVCAVPAQLQTLIGQSFLFILFLCLFEINSCFHRHCPGLATAEICELERELTATKKNLYDAQSDIAQEIKQGEMYLAKLTAKTAEVERLKEEHLNYVIEVESRAVKQHDQLTIARELCREVAENEIVQQHIAIGVPHGRNSTYPDGCECDACENWLSLHKALTRYQTESKGWDK